MAGRGVLTVLDEAEDRGVDTCTSCPTLCRWSCPVAETEARETTSPQRMVVLSGLLKRQRATPEMVSNVPYHCSHCLACTEACLHDNDVPMWLSLARSRVLVAGKAPPEVREVLGRFGVAGNPQGHPLNDALERVVEASGTRIGRGGDRVYFPGCTTLASSPDVATDFLRASQLAGVGDVTVRPASASCCGLPLLWAGEIEGFRGHAQRFAAQFDGVETLLVHEPTCAHALRHYYPRIEVSLTPRVVHVVDFLAKFLGVTTDLRRPKAAEVAYADTCNLTRGLRLERVPRRLLDQALGGAWIELDEPRGMAVDCCGASGLLPLTVPTTAAAMAENRIDAFRRSGAQKLAMSSPRCAAHLRNVNPTLDIVDVTTLLARA